MANENDLLNNINAHHKQLPVNQYFINSIKIDLL